MTRAKTLTPVTSGHTETKIRRSSGSDEERCSEVNQPGEMTALCVPAERLTMRSDSAGGTLQLTER